MHPTRAVDLEALKAARQQQAGQLAALAISTGQLVYSNLAAARIATHDHALGGIPTEELDQLSAASIQAGIVYAQRAINTRINVQREQQGMG